LQHKQESFVIQYQESLKISSKFPVLSWQSLIGCPIPMSVEEFLSRLRLGTFWIDTYNAYRRSLPGGPLGKRFFGLKYTETSTDRDQILTTGRGHEARRF